jgi:hypothetical protein
VGHSGRVRVTTEKRKPSLHRTEPHPVRSRDNGVQHHFPEVPLVAHSIAPTLTRYLSDGTLRRSDHHHTYHNPKTRTIPFLSALLQFVGHGFLFVFRSDTTGDGECSASLLDSTATPSDNTRTYHSLFLGPFWDSDQPTVAAHEQPVRAT